MMTKNTFIDYFKEKKVIVTGGTGLIGRSVVNKLCNYGAKVTIISLDKMKIDAPVGAISAHGTCGVWGLLAVALTSGSLFAQIYGILVILKASIISIHH